MSEANGCIVVLELSGSLESAQVVHLYLEELLSFTPNNCPELWCNVVSSQSELWPYLISTHGRVMSLGGRKGAISGLILEQVDKGDYWNVNLRLPARRWQPNVHVVEAGSFLGWQIGKQVNHKNRDGHNNFIWNLEWSTPSENQIHRYHHGGNGEVLSAAEAAARRGASNGRNGKKYEVAPGVHKTMTEMTDEEFARVIPF